MKKQDNIDILSFLIFLKKQLKTIIIFIIVANSFLFFFVIYKKNFLYSTVNFHETYFPIPETLKLKIRSELHTQFKNHKILKYSEISENKNNLKLNIYPSYESYKFSNTDINYFSLRLVAERKIFSQNQKDIFLDVYNYFSKLEHQSRKFLSDVIEKEIALLKKSILSSTKIRKENTSKLSVELNDISNVNTNLETKYQNLNILRANDILLYRIDEKNLKFNEYQINYQNVILYNFLSLFTILSFFFIKRISFYS